MNERIRQLAEQAHSYACEYAQQPDYNEHNPYNQGMYKQRYDSKFAELIVRECIDIADKEDFDVMMKEGYPCSQTAKKIREHFGVEE